MGKKSKKSPHDLKKAAKRTATDASTSRATAATVDGTGLEAVEVISIPGDSETEEKPRRKSHSKSQSENKDEDVRRTKKKHRKHKKAEKEKKRSRKKFKKLIKEMLAQSTEATNLDKELDKERSSEYKECTRKNDDDLDEKESKRNKYGEADETGDSKSDKRNSHVNRSSSSQQKSYDWSFSQSCADNTSSPQKSLEKKSSPLRTSYDSWSSSRKRFDKNSPSRSYYNMISLDQKSFDKRKSCESSTQINLKKRKSSPQRCSDNKTSRERHDDSRNPSPPQSYYNMIALPQKSFDKRSSSRSSSPQRSFEKKQSSSQKSHDDRKSSRKKSHGDRRSSPRRSCVKRNSSRNSGDNSNSPQRNSETRTSSSQRSHDNGKSSRKKSYDDRKSSDKRSSSPSSNSSSSSHRSFEKTRSSSQKTSDNKTSSLKKSCDDRTSSNFPQGNSKLDTRRSSPQRSSHDNGKRSRKKSYDDRKSSPKRSFDKRSSSRSSADSSSSPQKRLKTRKSSPQRSHDTSRSSRKISYYDGRSFDKRNLPQRNSKLETRESSPGRSHGDGKSSRRKSLDKRSSSRSSNSSSSSQRSFEKKTSSPQKTRDNKTSSRKKSCDDKRSSLQMLQRDSKLETRTSSPQRSHDTGKSSRKKSYDDRNSSPQRNSGRKGEERTTRSWDRRGSSSEREDVSKTHSKDRPEVAKKIEDDFFFARPKEHPLLPRCIALDVRNGTTGVKSRTNMGKKSNNKKPKFRALDVQKLEEEDKKVTASTSRAAASTDGGTGHETVVDIPLPANEQSPAANCQAVENKEGDHHSGKMQSRHRTRPNQNEPAKVGGAWSSQSNESRNRKWGPRSRSKERPKDTTGSGNSPWGNEGQGQSRLNINAKAFEPSSSGRTAQNWDSATDDNSEAKFPLEPVQNFNQAVDHKPKMNWAEAMAKEENISQAKFTEPIEEITNQWPKATKLDSEQDNDEQSWRKPDEQHKESASKNDDGWRSGSRYKHGEADGANRRSYDKKRNSPQRRSYDNKRSSPQRRSYDNKRSSPQRSNDNRRNSSPQRNNDYRRSSPSRNSYGGGRGEGAIPTWGERGSSSERDGEFKDYCNLVRSKDRTTEFVKVKEIEGDLFAQPKEYSLAHCVAEDMGMGSGIAVQFRRDFKRVDELLNQRERQGGLAILEDGDRYIYYLVTKKASNGKPTNHTLFCSLKKLRQHMFDHKITKLAIPRIGCGLDRLEWSHIKLMLEFLFRDADVEIIVCNYQQDENVPPSKLKSSHVVNYDKPIQNIEDNTIIIYMTSAEDDDTSQEMRELDKKFPSLLVQFRNSPRHLGTAIAYDKNPGYRLYGCVVRRKKSDPFDYVEFQKCIGTIEKDNRKHGFWYVAFQAVTDPKDDMINDKVVNIVRNGIRNVEVYVCPGPE